MKLYFECMPCVVGQLTNTIKRFIKDEKEQYRVLKESINSFYNQVHENSSAPILAGAFFEKIKAATGIEDLYVTEKDLFNKEMLALEDDFRNIINVSDDPLKTALLLSAAANIIDFGVLEQIEKDDALNAILKAAKKEREYPAIEKLKTELANAKQLLYVGDNCGEVVLDKLVLEVLRDYYPDINIVYAVRGAPILNDVTLKEAYEVGIDQFAKVISSGSNIPGTILSHCTGEVQQFYRDSDVVLFKGMGNLETAAKDEKDAYFIFMVKCEFMAKHIGANLYDIMITKGNHLYEENRGCK